MKVALVYPPSCDPTSPYLSLPTLAAWLRSHGVEVVAIDANVECWSALLQRGPLERAATRLEQRLARLERREALTHVEQLEYASLWASRAEAAEVPTAIESAVALLRGAAEPGFYEPSAYESAVTTVQAATRLLGAAHGPLALDFQSYRTPFALLTMAEVARDARPERNPFHEPFVALGERLAALRPDVVGLSVAFPSQLQPAFALGQLVRQRLPEAHLTAGGPALSQLLVRLGAEQRERVLGPIDTAVIGEGEHALLELVRALGAGQRPARAGRCLVGQTVTDLGSLPAPDFSDLPLDRYLSPELVLPYDPSRGCTWGRCAFCHYGPVARGTARYRERPVEQVVTHLGELAQRHGARLFYLSHDMLSPGLGVKLARAVRERGLRIRWSSDLRPERVLDSARCRELAAGGALSLAIGIESGDERVLALIDKGATVAETRAVVERLADAGVAVEAMCFTDFPTETAAEARRTMRLLDELAERVALFVLCRFGLSHGSRVAHDPTSYGIDELWHVEGDELGTGLFYEERVAPKSEPERERLEREVARLSRRWTLRPYPWAGSLSTAHTMLWLDRLGPRAFAVTAGARPPHPPRPRWHEAPARFDVASVAEQSAANEAELWNELVYERRRVSRAAYLALARTLPKARPRPGQWRYAIGAAPERVRKPQRSRQG